MNSMISKDFRRDAQRALDDVAGSLRRSGERFTGDAQEAVRQAATEVSRAAEDLRKTAARTGERTARKAARQVRAHPLAVALGAATAFAVLAGLVAATRRRGRAAAPCCGAD